MVQIQIQTVSVFVYVWCVYVCCATWGLVFLKFKKSLQEGGLSWFKMLLVDFVGRRSTKMQTLFDSKFVLVKGATSYKLVRV